MLNMKFECVKNDVETVKNELKIHGLKVIDKEDLENGNVRLKIVFEEDVNNNEQKIISFSEC